MKMKQKHMGVCKWILPGLLVIAAVGCYQVTDDGTMDRDTDTFEPSTTDSLPEGLPDSATDTDTDDTETIAAPDMIDEYLVHGTDSDLDTADEVNGEWDTDWYVDGQLVYIDTPHPYHPDRDGFFIVEVRELPGVFSDISVSAQFYVNPGGWSDLTGVMPLYVDEGMDSCVLVRESPIGVGSDNPWTGSTREMYHCTPQQPTFPWNLPTSTKRKGGCATSCTTCLSLKTTDMAKPSA